MIIFLLLWQSVAFANEAEFKRGLEALDAGNHSEAFEILSPLAEQGFLDAQYAVGVMYDKGLGVSQDYKIAAKWFEKAAEQGDSYAQYNLAIMYLNGQGVLQDYSIAAKWFGKAANQGDTDAQYNLGVLYANGHGVQKNLKLSFIWFGVAAGGEQEGGLKGMEAIEKDMSFEELQDATNIILSCMEAKRIGCESVIATEMEFQRGVKLWQAENYKEALVIFRPLASLGHAGAQNNIGNIYRDGLGVSKDYKESLKWFRKSAEQGNKFGQHNLASYYYVGIGVSQDYKKAFEWYTKSANQRYMLAQHNLATMYDRGEGVSQNHKIAVKWFTKSAKQGYENSQNDLGMAYAQGKGVPASPKLAYMWLTIAEANGYEISTGAMDWSVRKMSSANLQEAKGLAQQCIDSDYENCASHEHINTDIHAEYERGVDAYNADNFGDAFAIWKPLAEQGHAGAQYNFGRMYRLGDGVPQDNEKAAKWYNLAARQGYSQAQNDLGVLYSTGTGVVKDHKHGYMWFYIAELNGHGSMEKALKELSKAIHPAEIQLIKKLAKQCINSDYKDCEEPIDLNAEYHKGFELSEAKNYKEAFATWKPLAEGGVPVVQVLIGNMYADGEGVTQDYKKALEWYRKAAGQGFAAAHHALGVRYANGEGVPQSFMRAHMWFFISNAGGFEYAKEPLYNSAGELTSDELQESQRLAEQCIESDYKNCE